MVEAGSGLVHAELSPEAFKRTGGELEILQIWINLPARLKMTAPAYIPVPAADIAGTDLGGGVTMRALSGTEGAPIHSLTDVMLAIVSVDSGGSATLPAPAGRNVFFYTVSGEAQIDGESVPQHTLAQMSDGDGIELFSDGGCRILFGHADPIGEPVVAHGPLVINSKAEIAQAVRDYQAGRFGGV